MGVANPGAEAGPRLPDWLPVGVGTSAVITGWPFTEIIFALVTFKPAGKNRGLGFKGLKQHELSGGVRASPIKVEGDGWHWRTHCWSISIINTERGEFHTIMCG
jgi:hypothetical protein